MTDTVVVKKLSELLVKDLRAELEKRGLDHKGVKAVLLERLQEVMGVFMVYFFLSDSVDALCCMCADSFAQQAGRGGSFSLLPCVVVC